MNLGQFVGAAAALCGLASTIDLKEAEQANGLLRTTKRVTTNSNRISARSFHTDVGETHHENLVDGIAYGLLNALESPLKTR